MSILVVMSVYDQGVSSFGRPFFVPAVGAAVRSFSDEINRESPDNLMCNHPEDFFLYRLGTYDEESGHFDTLVMPERISAASDFKIIKGE